MNFMQANLPYLLAGISVGGQYALIAIGYTMVYGILRLINFAHGDVFMIAGLIMVYAAASLPLYIAIPLVLVVTVVIGFLIERVAYKPLRSAPRMSVMISAIGVSYLLQNLALYVTGGLSKMYPTIPFISDSVTIGTATTKMVTLITPVLTLVLVVVLVLFIQKPKSAWPCGRFPRILKPASLWASRSIPSSAPPSSSAPSWRRWAPCCISPTTQASSPPPAPCLA